MELSTKIKYENKFICRICLVQSDTNSIDLKMFEYCTGINISETPQATQICAKCNNSLKDFSSFKIKCIESHESLIKMYSENKNKQICEVWLNNENIDNKMFEVTEKPEKVIEEDQINNTERVCEVWLDDKNIDTKLFEIVENTEELIEEDQIIYVEELEAIDDSIEWAFEDDRIDQDETSNEEKNIKSKSKDKKRTKSIKKKGTTLSKRTMDLCMYCGKSYHCKNLQQHIKKMHMEPVLTERHKCDQCEKTYKRKEALMRHKRFHNNAKPYACNSCDESFLFWTSRRDHMVYAHNAPYRFNCEICEYKTQQSSAFSRHKRQHTGELPFECDECKKQFIDGRQLRAHMVSHTKEKKFICEICKKAFGTYRYLKAHMKIHTQERNYICPVESCGKSFIQNHVLKSHMKSNHPEVEIPASGTIVSQKKDSKARNWNLKNVK